MIEPEVAMYWRRRAVAVAVVLGLVLLVVWAVSGPNQPPAGQVGPGTTTAGFTELAPAPAAAVEGVPAAGEPVTTPSAIPSAVPAPAAMPAPGAPGALPLGSTSSSAALPPAGASSAPGTPQSGIALGQVPGSVPAGSADPRLSVPAGSPVPGSVPPGQTGALPQSQTGALPQSQTGALPQGQTGALPQGQTGALPQGQTGALPQGQTGALPQGQTGLAGTAQPGNPAATPSARPPVTVLPPGAAAAPSSSALPSSSVLPPSASVKPSKPAKPSKPSKPAKPGDSEGAGASSAPSAAPGGAQTALAPCADNKIGLVAQVNATSYKIGQKPLFRLVVANLSDKACTRDLDPGLQQLVVNSPDGKRIWDSNDCFPQRKPDVRTLEPGKAVVFPVSWAGRTSSPGCGATRASVPAGNYQLTAKLGQLQSAPAPFTLTP